MVVTRSLIAEIVNSRPQGISLRELSDELNMFAGDSRIVCDTVLRMIERGSISHIGDITDPGVFSAILMPRLVGVPSPKDIDSEQDGFGTILTELRRAF